MNEISANRQLLEELNEIHSNFINIISQFFNFLKSIDKLSRETIRDFKISLFNYRMELKKIIEKYKKIEEESNNFIKYLEENLKKLN